MTNRASIRSALALSVSLLLFLNSLRLAALPQSTVQNTDRTKVESAINQKFLSALSAYKAERYTAAQAELEPLVKANPDSFQVNELLGLVCVAQGKQHKANAFLAKAVHLMPSVAEARTALGTNLLMLQRANEAEVQFKKVVEMTPQSYDANHNLGEFYIQTGKIAAAVPFLRRAQQIDRTAYNNGYDLALALDQLGRIDESREQLQQLVTLQDSAELHSLLGEVEEKAHSYVSSAREYQQAAQMDPSEQNMLNWGAELLLHQTFSPAIEVFQAGTQRYPRSAQLQNGLGIAFYGAGQMDDAAHAFLRASDLTPSDPLPLTFLGKACDETSPDLAGQILSRLQSFIGHDSQSAEVNYYLAVCLWKGNEIASKLYLGNEIESLLKHAITVDPNFADAYFQLGNFYSEQHRYEEAIVQYDRALKANAGTASVHYRLGQALGRVGNQGRAQEEFAIFEQLRKNESDASNKEQSQIQKFVYTIRKSDTQQQ